MNQLMEQIRINTTIYGIRFTNFVFLLNSKFNSTFNTILLSKGKCSFKMFFLLFFIFLSFFLRHTNIYNNDQMFHNFIFFLENNSEQNHFFTCNIATPLAAPGTLPPNKTTNCPCGAILSQILAMPRSNFFNFFSIFSSALTFRCVSVNA